MYNINTLVCTAINTLVCTVINTLVCTVITHNTIYYTFSNNSLATYYILILYPLEDFNLSPNCFNYI